MLCMDRKIVVKKIIQPVNKDALLGSIGGEEGYDFDNFFK